jgi:colicin import membrane protein
MAKQPKSRKSASRPRDALLAGPALRIVALRVGAAAALIAAAGGLYLWRGRPVEVARERPAAVAEAPASPGPLAALTLPAPEPETAPAPEPPRREASVEPAKPMSNALRAAFDSWLMAAYAKCWKAPKTLPEGEAYLPKVRVAFKEGGELASPPRLVNPPSDPAWKPHAEAALKAVKGCDPLHVPDKYAEYYPSWKSRTVYFDPTRN